MKLQVFILLLLPCLAIAEPKRHDKFFEPNYAGSIMNPGQSKRPRRDSGTTPPASESKEDTEVEEKVPDFVSPEESPSASPSPSPSATPDDTALKDSLEPTTVQSYGALLNATPSGVLFNQLEELVELSFKFNKPLGRIIVIGTMPRSETDREVLGISLRGGQLEVVDQPPDKYKVAKSPSWILETEKGEIVLEAFKSAEKFLNSRGDFVPNLLSPVGSSH